MKATPQSLHKEHLYLVIDKPNMYLNHQYQPNIRTWKFIGYRCSDCGQPLRQVGNIIKHNDLCRVRIRKQTKEEQESL